MAFGQELKDFVAGFQAGYKMIDSPEDKQYKRDARQREADRFQREEDWHKEGRADLEYNRKYRQGRDAVEDDRYRQGMERQNRNDAWSRYRAGVEDERQSNRDAESDRRARKQEQMQEDQIKLGVAKETGPTGDMDQFLKTDQNNTNPANTPAPSTPGNAGAIPDGNNTNAPADTPAPSGESSDASQFITSPRASYQTASAIPDDTARATPAAYRDNGIDSANPTSGPEIAAKMVHDLQRDFGLPQHIAIGVVGQLAGETRGFQDMQEKNPTVPGSRGGYGYAQWTGSRRRQFEQFASDGGADPSSYQANYQYLRNELANTSESGVLDKMRNAPDAQTAGRIFTDTFLRPGVPNYGGRSRWTDMVGRAVQDLGDGQSGSRRRAVSAAVGGMVSAIPDDQEEQASLGNNAPDLSQQQPTQAPVPQPRPEQTALPEEGPVPQQRPSTPNPEYAGTSQGNSEEHTLDLSDYEAGRRAVRDGLHQALKTTGADQNEAISDPALEKARMMYLKGYGAAPQQMMRQVLDTIDPNRELPPAERNMKAMGTVYRYYMDRGDTEKAKEAAASMVQYYRQASQQFLGLAQAAAQDGRLDDAAKAAVAAYTNIPNGRDISINKDENGNYAVDVTDIKTGKSVHKQVVTPEQFGAAAMHFNPATFDEEIMRAAAIKPEEFKPQTPEKTQKTVDAVNTSAETALEGSKLNPEMQNLIKNTAANIAGVQANAKGSDEALQFAQGMLALDADQKNDKPNYTTEKILGNRDFVRVHMNGDTVVMSKGKLNQIEQARKTLLQDRSKAQKDDAASAERWKGIREKGAQALDDIGRSALSKDDINTIDSGIKAFQNMQQNNKDWLIKKLTPSQGDTAIPEDDRGLPPISGY